MLAVQSSVDLYDQIERPAYLLNRWALRRRHGVSTDDLRALAVEILGVLETVADVPIPEPELVVRECSQPEDIPEGARLLDDPNEKASLDILLESVRRSRHTCDSTFSELFVRALQARLPDMATRFIDLLARAQTRTLEIEKMLIVLGAGTDDDASLIMGLMPDTRFDLPSGGSVTFEL